jgi:hypothetical protein
MGGVGHPWSALLITYALEGKYRNLPQELCKNDWLSLVVNLGTIASSFQIFF